MSSSDFFSFLNNSDQSDVIDFIKKVEAKLPPTVPRKAEIIDQFTSASEDLKKFRSQVDQITVPSETRSIEITLPVSVWNLLEKRLASSIQSTKDNLVKGIPETDLLSVSMKEKFQKTVDSVDEFEKNIARISTQFETSKEDAVMSEMLSTQLMVETEKMASESVSTLISLAIAENNKEMFIKLSAFLAFLEGRPFTDAEKQDLEKVATGIFSVKEALFIALEKGDLDAVDRILNKNLKDVLVDSEEEEEEDDDDPLIN